MREETRFVVCIREVLLVVVAVGMRTIEACLVVCVCVCEGTEEHSVAYVCMRQE